MLARRIAARNRRIAARNRRIAANVAQPGPPLRVTSTDLELSWVAIGPRYLAG